MRKYCTITFKSDNLYDCYIYKKILYLITRDKTVIPIDWYEFINSESPIEDSFAFTLSFLRGDVLYDKSFDLFRKTPTIRNDILNSFQKIKNHNYVFELTRLLDFAQKKKWWRKIEQLPAEIRCYKNRLYFLQNNGLYYFSIQANSTAQTYRNVLSRSRLLVRGHYVNFNFVGLDLLLCGLDDGLFILNYFDSTYNESPIKISNCNTAYICNNFSSFLRGSYISNSEVYRTEKSDQESRKIINRNELLLNNDFNYFSLFDKIYRIKGNVIEYSNYYKDKALSFERINVNLSISSNDFVSATVAVFGLIIEEKTRLIIIPSDPAEDVLIIGGDQDPIISWRIYPSSIDYKNQLHVIFYDRLVIYSFFYDYFINQSIKKIGAKRFIYHSE